MRNEILKSALSRGWRYLSAGLAAATMLAGVATAPAFAQGADTIVIARDMDFDSLDPARSFCDTCQIYLSSTYQRLVDLDKDNKTIIPLLATKWELNADQSEFTFHLNPDAKFSDGSPVEAKDVKWSWERLKNIKGGAAYMMDSVASIETPDEHTVVAKLTAPNSEFVGVLTAPYTGVINSDVAIENKANADADADKTDQAEPWFLANSAGSGPFVLVSYKPDDELRLKRNDAYWGTKPAAGEIVIRETKDAVSQSQMLESGDADIAMQIDPDTAKNVTSADVTIETVPSFNFVYVVLSPGAKGLPHPLTPKIREAIAHAIDYDGVIELTVGGAGKRQASPIPNGFPGSESLTPVAHDLDLAKKMMADEGVADGFTLQSIFPNVNQYGVDFTVMMQKVQQDLAEINVKLELQPVEFSVWREHVNGDGIPVTAVFFAPDFFGSSQYPQYFGMMEGTSWSKRAGAKNDPSVLNPAEAEGLKLALATGGAESAKHFGEVGEAMMKDYVILPLVSPDLVLAYRKNITGVRYSACCNLPTAELARK